MNELSQFPLRLPFGGKLINNVHHLATGSFTDIPLCHAHMQRYSCEGESSRSRTSHPEDRCCARFLDDFLRATEVGRSLGPPPPPVIQGTCSMSGTRTWWVRGSGARGKPHRTQACTFCTRHACACAQWLHGLWSRKSPPAGPPLGMCRHARGGGGAAKLSALSLGQARAPTAAFASGPGQARYARALASLVVFAEGFTCAQAPGPAARPHLELQAPARMTAMLFFFSSLSWA